MPKYRCFNCMPDRVFIDGQRNFRDHMRIVHGFMRLSEADCDKYVVPDNTPEGPSVPAHGEVKMSVRQFTGFFQQVNDSIQNGIDRGLTNAFQVSDELSDRTPLYLPPVQYFVPTPLTAVYQPAGGSVFEDASTPVFAIANSSSLPSLTATSHTVSVHDAVVPVTTIRTETSDISLVQTHDHVVANEPQNSTHTMTVSQVRVQQTSSSAVSTHVPDSEPDVQHRQQPSEQTKSPEKDPNQYRLVFPDSPDQM